MINVEQLKEFLGCDEKFLAHLMQKFIQESGEGVGRLRTATDNKNWPLVKASAHKMLSSTRIFNINELSEQLEKIEEIAETEKNTDQIPPKVDLVTKAWKEVVEEINAVLPKLKADAA